MIVVGWILFAVLLAASALLRAAGASLVRTHRADALHDAAEGTPGAAVVADLLDDPRPLQAELGLPTAALALGAVAAGTWAIAASLTGGAAVVGVLGVWLVVVVVGDLLPRGFGRARPRRLAYRLAGLLAAAVGIGAAASDLVTDEEDAEPEAHDDAETARHEEAERELISSVIEFGDAIVREVMIPRTDMVSLPATASSDEALDLLVETGFSRIPVIGAGVDDVVGIVFARDMLRILDEGRHGVSIEAFMRTPSFVPETKRVPDLLRFMQSSRVHMVIVVDEFGGTAGIATIEDLLEELVGEIADEFDEDEEMVLMAEDGSLLIDARFPIDDFAELLDVELPDEDWDTVGGLVLSLSGRVPRIGERFEVEGMVLSPTRVQGRRIAQVRVTRP
jgi:CBS domain containing-hemolysin-like protein